MRSPVPACPRANRVDEQQGARASAMLHRPRVLHALHHATWEHVRTAFADAWDDAAVRGVLVTGAGEKVCIAGADSNACTPVTAVEAKTSRRYGQEVLVLRRRSDSTRRCSHA